MKNLLFWDDAKLSGVQLYAKYREFVNQFKDPFKLTEILEDLMNQQKLNSVLKLESISDSNKTTPRRDKHFFDHRCHKTLIENN